MALIESLDNSSNDGSQMVGVAEGSVNDGGEKFSKQFLISDGHSG